MANCENMPSPLWEQGMAAGSGGSGSGSDSTLAEVLAALGVASNSFLVTDANGAVVGLSGPALSAFVTNANGDLVPITSTAGAGVPDQLVKDPITNEMVFKPIGGTQTVTTAISSITTNAINAITEYPLTLNSTLTNHFPGSFSNTGNDLVFTAPIAGYYQASANLVADTTVQVVPTAASQVVFTTDVTGPDGTSYRLTQAGSTIHTDSFVGYVAYQSGSGASPAILLQAGDTLTFEGSVLQASDGSFSVQNVLDNVFSVTMVA